MQRLVGIWLVIGAIVVLVVLSRPSYAANVYYVAGSVAALGAALTYSWNAQFQRAKWLAELHQKFFDNQTYREVRNVLDREAGSTAVDNLLKENEPALSEYLNFFHFVALIRNRGQIASKDVENLFSYYLECLKRHAQVKNYIENRQNKFVALRKMLKELKNQD